MAALKACVKSEPEDPGSTDVKPGGGGVTWEIVGESEVRPLPSDPSPWTLQAGIVKTEVAPTSTSNTCIAAAEFAQNECHTCGPTSRQSSSSIMSPGLKLELIKEEPVDLEFDYDYERPSTACDENPSTQGTEEPSASASAISADAHRTHAGDTTVSGSISVEESTSDEYETDNDSEVDVEGVDQSESDEFQENSSWLKISDVRSGEEQVQAMLAEEIDSGLDTSSGSRKRGAPDFHESRTKRRKEKLTVREAEGKIVMGGKLKKGASAKKKTPRKNLGHTSNYCMKQKRKARKEARMVAEERENLMTAVATASASFAKPGTTASKVCDFADVSSSSTCAISRDSKSLGLVYPHCSCDYKTSAEMAPGGEAQLKHVAVLHFINKRIFAFIRNGEPFMSFLELKELGLLPMQAYVLRTVPSLPAAELKESSSIEMTLLRKAYPSVAVDRCTATMITPYGLTMVYKEAQRHDSALVSKYTPHMNSMFYLQRYNHKCPWTLLVTPTSDENVLSALKDFNVECPPTKSSHKPLILAARKKAATTQPNAKSMKSSVSKALIYVLKEFGSYNVEPYCRCETTTAELAWRTPYSSSGVHPQIGRLLFLGTKWLYCWIRTNGIFVSVQELKVLGLLPWKKRFVEDMLIGSEDVKDRTYLSSSEVSFLKPFASSITGELSTCLINVKFLRLIYRCLARFEQAWAGHVKSKFFIKLREHRCPSGFVNPGVLKTLTADQQCAQPEKAHVTAGHETKPHAGSTVHCVGTVVTSSVTRSFVYTEARTGGAAPETESTTEHLKAAATDVQSLTETSSESEARTGGAAPETASTAEHLKAAATDAQSLTETSESEARDSNLEATEGAAEEELRRRLSGQPVEKAVNAEKEGSERRVDIRIAVHKGPASAGTGREQIQIDSSNVGSVQDKNKKEMENAKLSAGPGLSLKMPPGSQLQQKAGKGAVVIRIRARFSQPPETRQKPTPQTAASTIAEKPRDFVVYVDEKRRNEGLARVVCRAECKVVTEPQPNAKGVANKPSDFVLILESGADGKLSLKDKTLVDQTGENPSFKSEDYPRACGCRPPPSPFYCFAFQQCVTALRNECMLINKQVGLAVLLPGKLNMVVYTFWKRDRYYFSVGELLHKGYFPATMDFSQIPQIGPAFWFLEMDSLDHRFLKQQKLSLKMSRFCHNLISAELLCHLTTMAGCKAQSLTQAGICLLQIGHTCPDTSSTAYALNRPAESAIEAWNRNAGGPVAQPRKLSSGSSQDVRTRKSRRLTVQGDPGSIPCPEGEVGDSDSPVVSGDRSSAQAVSSSTVRLQHGREYGIAVRVIESPPASSSNSKPSKPAKLTPSDFFMYCPPIHKSSTSSKSNLGHLIDSIGKNFTQNKFRESKFTVLQVRQMETDGYLEQCESQLLFEGKCVTKVAAADKPVRSSSSSPSKGITAAEPEEVDCSFIRSSLGAQASDYWLVLTGSIAYVKQRHTFAAMKLEEEVYISWRALALVVGNADLISQLGRLVNAHVYDLPAALRVHLSSKNVPMCKFHENPWISLRELRAVYWLAFYNGDVALFPKTFSNLRSFVVDEVPMGKFEDFVLIKKTKDSLIQCAVNTDHPGLG